MYLCRYSNLPKKEQKALKELKHMQVIVITNADKGITVITNAGKRVTVAILDLKDYIKDPERQLNNTEY